jgi:hypothetical protein
MEHLPRKTRGNDWSQHKTEAMGAAASKDTEMGMPKAIGAHIMA